jgi:cation diffusion facilitator family transporter
MTSKSNLSSADKIAKLKEQAAIASVFASVAITLGKAVAAWLSGSLALLSEALHGLVDIGATLVTWYAVRVSDKPADDDHHFGHGKMESLAALGEAALLFGLSGAVAWEAAQRLWSGYTQSILVTPLVVAVLLVSLIIDATRWRALSIIAKDTGSEVLAADALHFSSDFVSTAFTLIGLFCVMAGYAKADSIAALMVAIFIIIAASRLLSRTVSTLTDAAPKGATARVSQAAEAVAGVVALDWVRLRQAGGRVRGEVGVKVSRTMPLEQAAELKDKIAHALLAAEPMSDITITANPIEVDEETAHDKIMVTAARLKLPVHRVLVQRLGTRLCISLDMEVDGNLTLQVAHDRASLLEAEIKAAFGGDTEVDTHIEPLEAELPDGTEASSEWLRAISQALILAAEQGDIVRDIHSVRARQTHDGSVVVYHCRVDPSLDVATVHHAVDAVERLVRSSTPGLRRLTGHAEPRMES